MSAKKNRKAQKLADKMAKAAKREAKQKSPSGSSGYARKGNKSVHVPAATNLVPSSEEDHLTQFIKSGETKASIRASLPLSVTGHDTDIAIYLVTSEQITLEKLLAKLNNDYTVDEIQEHLRREADEPSPGYPSLGWF